MRNPLLTDHYRVDTLTDNTIDTIGLLTFHNSIHFVNYDFSMAGFQNSIDHKKYITDKIIDTMLNFNRSNLQQPHSNYLIFPNDFFSPIMFSYITGYSWPINYIANKQLISDNIKLNINNNLLTYPFKVVVVYRYAYQNVNTENYEFLFGSENNAMKFQFQNTYSF